MIDGVYFITVYWLLSVTAITVFTLVLYTQLHRASTTNVSLQFKAVLFGASSIDVVSLCLVGLTLLGSWYIGDEDETEEYCASLSWPASLINIHLMLIVFIVVWLREVFLLKDAKLPVERFIFKNTHLANNRCLKAIINGPSYWLILPVLVSMLLAVLAIQNGEIGPNPDDFIFCIIGPTIHWPTMATFYVYLTILWALVTVMTTNILKQQRLHHDVSILFSISDSVDKKKSSSLGDKTTNSDKEQISSQLPLFLAMSSIWLPPIQCLFMIAIFDFSALTQATVIFMTLVYSCLITTLSLILSVCVCGSLWTNNRLLADDVIAKVT